MDYQIGIAGVHISIISQGKLKLDHQMKRFLIKEKNKVEADIHLSIIRQKEIPLPQDLISLDDHIKWMAGDGEEDEIRIYIKDKEENMAAYCLITNKRWNRATILMKNTDRYSISLFRGSLGEILFRNYILNQQGIVIHAAAIQCEHNGIVFSAPSGTGKTTQANLWRKYKKATMINADRPAIKIQGEEAYVYGTLWNGSSPKCMNSYAKLKAIVMIEQAPHNSITKLSGKEALSKLMPRCFLPYFTKEMMNIALINIEKIIERTPVYLLKCRPDKEAVELVSQCLE